MTDAVEARLCPTCFAGTLRRDQACWMCGSGLPAWEQRAEASAAPAAPAPADQPAHAPAAGGADAADRVGWLVVLVTSCLVALLVGVELALWHPGLLVPFAALALPLFVLLVRTARAQLRPADAASAPGGAPAPGGPTASRVRAEEVLGAVALGIGSVFVVLAALALIAVASLVLLFAICFGVLVVAGH